MPSDQRRPDHPDAQAEESQNKNDKADHEQVKEREDIIDECIAFPDLKSGIKSVHKRMQRVAD